MSWDTEPAIYRCAISCLMPVYNCEKYLERSISSILSQTFRDFELIIINDGSTDLSGTIIEQMRQLDSRIVVIHQPNKGITASLNAGLAAARGQFIARMDADDISMPERFAIQHDFLCHSQDVVLVGGLAATIDEVGIRLAAPTTGNRHKLTNLHLFPPKIITAVHPLIMVRADVLRSAGGYSSEFEHAEDYELFIRLSRWGRLVHVDAHVLDYRTHGQNVSVTKLQQQERNAAAAELHNVKAERARLGKELRLASQTFDAYIAIRILRRQRLIKIYPSPLTYVHILRNIVRGAFQSEAIHTGRLLLMLAVHGMMSIRVAFHETRERPERVAA